MENESQTEQCTEQEMDILVEIEDLRAIVGGDDKADKKKETSVASSMCPW